MQLTLDFKLQLTFQHQLSWVLMVSQLLSPLPGVLP